MTSLTASAPSPDFALQLAAVRALGVLDTPRDPAFDRLVFIASQLFRAPVAAVSLLDGDRMWYKASVGTALKAVPRARSFCGMATAQPGPLLIEDAATDPRFQDGLTVGLPGMRFYAGAPLAAPEGLCAGMGTGALAIGTLCVMDRCGRRVTPAQMSHLVQLAREASALLALRATA